MRPNLVQSERRPRARQQQSRAHNLSSEIDSTFDFAPGSVLRARQLLPVAVRLDCLIPAPPALAASAQGRSLVPSFVHTALDHLGKLLQCAFGLISVLSGCNEQGQSQIQCVVLTHVDFHASTLPFAVPEGCTYHLHKHPVELAVAVRRGNADDLNATVNPRFNANFGFPIRATAASILCQS